MQNVGEEVMNDVLLAVALDWADNVFTSHRPECHRSLHCGGYPSWL